MLRSILSLTLSLALVQGAKNPRVESFTIRLSTVPMDASMRNTVAGKGSAKATLAGNVLTISGSFEGLVSPATVARIHQGRVTGVRGPAIGDLTVDNAVNGAISGKLNLTPEQLVSLRKGRLYLQVHSEKAPDGNLWGWLLG
jgi:hypothetical protein